MKNSFGFTWYLAGLSMLGYLAMDMYLPAFGAMGEQLQISAGAVGASLSIFLAGFAVGHDDGGGGAVCCCGGGAGCGGWDLGGCGGRGGCVCGVAAAGC